MSPMGYYKKIAETNRKKTLIYTKNISL